MSVDLETTFYVLSYMLLGVLGVVLGIAFEKWDRRQRTMDDPRDKIGTTR